jgi:hypothetical protein
MSLKGLDAKTNWLAVNRQSYDFDPVSRELSSAKEAQKRWRYSSVDSSVVRYSPDSKDVRTEAAESPLLGAVTKQRLVTTP